MDDQQWLKHLSDKLNDYEEPAPEGLWDDIAGSLSGGAAVPKPEKKRHAAVMPLWLRRVSAAAAVVAIAVAIWLAAGIDTTKIDQQPAETYTDNTLNNDNIPTLAETDTRREAEKVMENTTTSTVIQPVRSLAAATGSVVATTQIADASTASHEINAVQEKNVNQENKVTQAGNAAKEEKVDSVNIGTPTYSTSPTRRENIAENRQGYNQPVIQATKRAAASRLALNLYAANLTGASSSVRENGPTLRSQYMSGEGLAEFSDIQTVVKMSNTNKVVEHKMNHKFPVRAGVSLRYDLNSRLALSTGLQYSYLASDFSWGSNESFYSGTQKLHYLGIPVSLIANIWGNDRISIYATGGMTMEKCIDGQTTTDYILNGDYQTRERTDATEKRVQWSATAAVGVQCRLVSRLSLYAEPGVCYYIDNHSSTDNIYKERPFNFNFNLGLRFTLH